MPTSATTPTTMEGATTTEAEAKRQVPTAVNSDLFLAAKLTRKAYAAVIDLFVERQVAPPTTAAEFHSAIVPEVLLLL